jgi:hypothetical protein
MDRAMRIAHVPAMNIIMVKGYFLNMRIRADSTGWFCFMDGEGIVTNVEWKKTCSKKESQARTGGRPENEKKGLGETPKPLSTWCARQDSNLRPSDS